MRMIISFFALFMSILLLQLSNGAVGPLDALSGIALNFSSAHIGLMGSAHYLGFFAGCWLAPRLMGDVGHSRTFATFTAIGAIGILGHFLIIDAWAWIIMRIASGLCIAGSYTVIEAWLQAKLTNEIRGRAMGTYRAVDMAGALTAQMAISVLPPASYVSYNILALLCCLSIVPLAITRTPQPATPEAPRLQLSAALMNSPLAVAGVIVAGITTAAFRMMGPVYGEQIGLSTAEIAWFLTSFVLGGALAQIPTGWMADKYDRRWVLIWMSVAAIVTCLAIAGANASTFLLLIIVGLFGFSSFPIYSLAVAHANDFATDAQRVELAASLMFFYAVGAIGAPFLASTLIEVGGPSSLFLMISVGHLGLIIFGLLRAKARPTQGNRTRYIYSPRTSFTVGQWLSRFRNRTPPSN